MLRLWRGRQFLDALDGFSCHATTIGFQCSLATRSTAVHSPSTDTSTNEPALTEQLIPAGSALFQENKHFTPVVSPDPLLLWDQLKRSLAARNLTPKITIEELIQMKEKINELEGKMAALEKKRQVAKVEYSKAQDKEQSRQEARRLKSERKAAKNTHSELYSLFQKETLSFPNFIHESYLPGSDSSLEKNLDRGHSRNTIRWPAVQDDLYTTPVGTFLTGKLAALEQSLLVDTRRYWLTTHGSEVSTYPVCLSDFARGPAVEGAAWPPVDKAIRIEPAQSDLLKVPADGAGESEQGSQWLVNPHTSSYLVGSASLASFAAYLLCNEIVGSNTLPIRLLSLGSVYQSSDSKCTDSDCLKLNHDADRCDQSQRPSDLSMLLPFRQQKQVALLELAPAWDACEMGYERLVNQLSQFWTQFQPVWSMRIVHTPPDRLWPCEMSRTVLELLPSGDADSIQLASVSLLGDWVSRRVGVKTSHKSGSSQNGGPYVYMIYARLMDTRSLLEGFQHTGILEQSGVQGGTPFS